MMLCNPIRLMILAFAVAGFAASASAKASAKAVVYDDGRIVYYYDDVDHSSDSGGIHSDGKH